MGLPDGYAIRAVEAGDYERGILDTLGVLTTVGDVSREKFAQIVGYWNSLKTIDGASQVYNGLVVVDGQQQVVATGMVFVEEKLIHQGGKVGHVEDISVRADQQGKQLGKLLISHLTQIARACGCYKVIMDCDQKNVGFYEKCGYSQAGVEMQQRF